ncbi:MAG: RNA polymerase sigma factor [Bacteroidetes bacterium]|nr:MAG: RNA polymerase sigma factor [Bacteroidota bacterium]
MSPVLEQQFAQLFDQYKSMVLQVCTGFLQGDKVLAHDLLQEVFINSWIALPNFKGEASAKTWIYRITVNTCLTHLRKQNGKRKLQVQGLPEQVAEIVADTSVPIDYHELYHAIGQLESTDRLIIMMVLDEMEYTEISNVMGISEGTLRVKIHRIKQRLKNIMHHG